MGLFTDVDVKTALARLIRFGPSHCDDYIYALMDVEHEFGPNVLSHKETLLVAAHSFDTCIQSSGLFSYFQLQPGRAQHGYEAMKEIELTDLSNVIAKSLAGLSLGTQATEKEIIVAARNAVEQDFEKLLILYEPLEEIYYNSSSVTEAIASYVKNNAKTLSQTPH